jgi:NADP-reducing hydrogenase subunit HndB
MTKLKSIEELQKIRQEAMYKIDLRSTAEFEDRVLIRVGMATCGIASGARETMSAIMDEIKKQGLMNVSVTQTGCMGYCSKEPIVEVVSKSMPSVIYGNVDEKRGREIINEHIINNRLLQDAIINKSFEKME